MPKRYDPENEIGAPASEPKMSRLEGVGLLVAVLLLAALLWGLVDAPPEFW